MWYKIWKEDILQFPSSLLGYAQPKLLPTVNTSFFVPFFFPFFDCRAVKRMWSKRKVATWMCRKAERKRHLRHVYYLYYGALGTAVRPELRNQKSAHSKWSPPRTKSIKKFEELFPVDWVLTFCLRWLNLRYFFFVAFFFFVSDRVSRLFAHQTEIVTSSSWIWW